MRTRLVVGFAVAFFLGTGIVGLGQAEIYVQDMSYGGKPFNPGDAGRVQQVLIADSDAANIWDVFLTRLSVENVGTAVPAEIAWVEARLEVDGKTHVLAQAHAFPIDRVLLDVPAEERMIPDDARAYLSIWVGVANELTDGHTIQTEVRLWYSEGEEGGIVDVLDGVAEELVMEGSFTAQALLDPQGGTLNPGDEFPIFQVEVEDTPDVNFLGLKAVTVRIDGPKELAWSLDNGITRLAVPPARDFRPEAPFFLALDEARGTLTVWAQVPADLALSEPLSVAPTITLTVREGDQEKTFRFTDTSPDTVVIAGLENLGIEVPKAGSILTAIPDSLSYSILTLADSDRNATPVRLDALELLPQGTVATEVQWVELTDDRGNLLGFGTGLGHVRLSRPDGAPLWLEDETLLTLNVKFGLSPSIPLGGSLLLAHRVVLSEAQPPERVPLSTARTQFQGGQTAVPRGAIFFGQPRVELRTVEDEVSAVEIWTDGETIGVLEGMLRYTPVQSVSVVAFSAFAPYRIARQVVDPAAGEVRFRAELVSGKPQPGQILTVSFGLLPEVDEPIAVSVQLEISTLVDIAGIALPYTLRPETVEIMLSP